MIHDNHQRAQLGPGAGSSGDQHSGSAAIMSPKGEHQSQTPQSQQQQQQQSQSEGQAHQQPQPLPLLRLSHPRHQHLMHESEEDDFVRDTDSPPPPDLVQDQLRDQLNGESAAVISGHHQHHHNHDHHFHHRHHHNHHRHNQQPHQQQHHRHHSHHVPSVAGPAHSHMNGCISSHVNGSIVQQREREQRHHHREDEGDGISPVPGIVPDRLSILSQEQLLSLRNQVHQKMRLSQSAGKLSDHQSQDPKSAAKPSSSFFSLPPGPLHRILSHLSLPDIIRVSLVCVTWHKHVHKDEDSEVWSRICTKKIPKSILKSDMLSSCLTCKSKIRALAFAWNPNDCSRNIYIKSNGLTLHRNPVAQSTDAARGLLGFHSGRHCWEICWQGPLGTVSVIGIATKDQQLQASGYVPLIGSSSHSWGWNLVENHLLFNGDIIGSYPQQNNAPKYQTGEKVRVVLDCDRHTLSFEKNDEFLGVAFIGLPSGKVLFPAVSAVYGNTEVSIVYQGLPLDG